MGLHEELQSKFNKYVDKNRKKIINDFCREIKESEVGDLTLDAYTNFKFWKYDQKKILNNFHKTFQNDTKDFELSFDHFCKWLWIAIDDEEIDLPGDVKLFLDFFRGEKGAEA